jgi:hypothetical protein
MGLARKALELALTVFAAAALPARAVEATLVADAHVNSALPLANSGTISNLNVGAGYTSLIEFDLGALPVGTTAAQVSGAVLRLYLNRVDTAGQMTVRPVNTAWSEDSVTYATLPPLGSSIQTVPVSRAGSYVTVDVTALVQGWINDPASNHGVALAADTASMQFDSKENDLSGHAAVLDVTLAATGPQGPAGPSGPTGLTGPVGPVGPAGAQGPPGAAGTAGPMGPMGPQGSSGATGPAGPSGSPGIVFRGAYLPVTNYDQGDAVSYQGSSYISIANGNQGNTPGSSPSAWSLLAAEGAAGDTGLPGVPGAAGPQGATGLQGPIGPQGPAGLQGSQGPQGVAGPAGAAGMNYRGSWNPGINYQANDASSFGGSTYLALAANFGMQPDLYPSVWTVLAAKGNEGPTGPAGVAATVSIGTVTTVAAGSQAAVINSGTPTEAVLNFTIPQGAAGAGGTGGGSSGTPGAIPGSMYHAVSFTYNYYSVSNTNSNKNEDTSVLTWLPEGCAATTLNVYSQQSAQITVMLREGTPGNMVDSGLACTAPSGVSCTATGGAAIAAGSFVDFHVTGENGTASAVWMALGCS